MSEPTSELSFNDFVSDEDIERAARFERCNTREIRGIIDEFESFTTSYFTPTHDDVEPVPGVEGLYYDNQWGCSDGIRESVMDYNQVLARSGAAEVILGLYQAFARDHEVMFSEDDILIFPVGGEQ